MRKVTTSPPHLWITPAARPAKAGRLPPKDTTHDPATQPLQRHHLPSPTPHVGPPHHHQPPTHLPPMRTTHHPPPTLQPRPPHRRHPRRTNQQPRTTTRTRPLQPIRRSPSRQPPPPPHQPTKPHMVKTGPRTPANHQRGTRVPKRAETPPELEKPGKDRT